MLAGDDGLKLEGGGAGLSIGEVVAGRELDGLRVEIVREDNEAGVELVVGGVENVVELYRIVRTCAGGG